MANNPSISPQYLQDILCCLTTGQKVKITRIFEQNQNRKEIPELLKNSLHPPCGQASRTPDSKIRYSIDTENSCMEVSIITSPKWIREKVTWTQAEKLFRSLLHTQKWQDPLFLDCYKEQYGTLPSISVLPKHQKKEAVQLSLF